MNGSSSNTSGAEVVSIGEIPRNVLPYLIDKVLDLATELKSLQAGDADLVALDFVLKSGSDRIPDAQMAEISRRLIATLARGIEGNTIFSATEPADHTKAWQKIDPVTSIPVGQYRIWDDPSNQWVIPSGLDPTTVYVPPQEFFGSIYVAPGSSTVSIDIGNFETENYFVGVTPTSLYQGAYQASVAFPNTYGWNISGRTNSQVSFYFSGIPNLGTSEAPIGLTFEVWVRANPT